MTDCHGSEKHFKYQNGIIFKIRCRQLGKSRRISVLAIKSTPDLYPVDSTLGSHVTVSINGQRVCIKRSFRYSKSTMDKKLLKERG